MLYKKWHLLKVPSNILHKSGNETKYELDIHNFHIILDMLIQVQIEVPHAYDQ